MNQRTVLCYGDSNTWGANPLDISRFPSPIRWTGCLASILGDQWKVIEEGLPNRTTAFDDPLIPFRRGDELFPVLLEAHLPVDVVVVMLGSNDPKQRVNGNVADAVTGLDQIGQATKGSGADLILVSPPMMIAPIKFVEFDGTVSITYIKELTGALKELASTRRYSYIDTSCLLSASSLDGVHLDEDGHRILAEAVANGILELNR